MTSLHVICDLGPPQSKILAAPMVQFMIVDLKIPIWFVCDEKEQL